MNESVILDTGAMFSSFANRDLVCNRQRQKTPIRMMTNVGSWVIEEAGEVTGY